MSEQAILSLTRDVDFENSALDRARTSHQKFIIKQQNEDLENAIGYYIEAIKLNPDIAEPYYRLAGLMYQSGQMTLDSAIEQCKTAITLEPNNVNAHIYAGYFLSMTEDYNSAQKEFKLAIDSNLFNSARPRLFLSDLIKREMYIKGGSISRIAKYMYYLVSGSFLMLCDTAALKMMFQTVADSVSVFSYRTIGETFEKVKMFSKAYSTYQKGMAKTEHGDIFYKKLGDLSMSNHDILSGLECYRKALKVTPDNREVLLKLATLLQVSFPDKIDEAIDYYNKLLEFNIDNDKIYYELGHLYLKKDDKLNSMSAFKLALAYDENNPYYNNSLAYAFVRAELYDDAIDYYQRAIKLNPDAKWTSIVCHALGAVYGEVKGNFEAAEATYQAGLVLDSNNKDLLLSLGDLLMAKGELDRAIRTYCDAIVHFPDDFMAYAKAGLALWEKDYIEEAIVAFHKSISLNPNFEISQNNLGVVYLDGMSSPKEALGFFKEAIRLNPNYTLAYFNTARAYQELGESKSAAEYYQMSLDLNKITNELDEEDIRQRLHSLFD